MSAEYEDVVNPAVNYRIHRWRRLRQIFAASSFLFLFAMLFFIATGFQFYSVHVSLIYLVSMIVCYLLRCYCHFRMLKAWVFKDLIVCPQCNYSLKSHDTQSCPECGYELDMEIRKSYERLRNGLD